MSAEIGSEVPKEATAGVARETPPLARPEFILPHGHKIEAWAAAYTPDGKTLITSGSSGLLMRWEVDKLPGGGKLLGGQSFGANAIAVAPDGRLFATGNWDHTIGLWGADGGQLALLKGHEDGVRSVAFSPDGRIVAAGQWTGEIHLWKAATLAPLVSRPIPAHSDMIFDLAFSPDGKHIATASKDGTVKVWKVTSLTTDSSESHDPAGR